ncbi:MAG TPA: PAS domain-containing sensor histidine kinase [Gemmatimonadaceae bacterium]|nr:PAS domain-containing sensor histidine kinase [Gemmatimonadaceae bacterium]
MSDHSWRSRTPTGSQKGASPRVFDSGAATEQQLVGGIAHETGELHRLLVESVDEYAIFALDPDGYILSWNPGAERFKGYTADEVIGKHFSIFYPQEKIDERFPEFELIEAARVGRFEDEGWRVRKDGSLFWANVVITALHDPSGRLVGYAKVTRDLSERRRAEEELRESEERFRLLVQEVRDYAIFMLDPTGHINTWNAGAERIKGYTADEVIGKHFSIFYTQEDLDNGKPPRELETATRTGVYEEEGWRVRKDGTQFWANVVITALRRPDGSLAGFAKVTRDLTERRAAQERAIDAARKAAASDEANRAKSDFLAAMSHELRTPLNAIGGYTELLAMGVRGPVNKEQVEDLQRIKRSQQHLLGIINDILNFSRIEAGQATYDLTAVPLADVIDGVSQMILPQAVGKGLKLEVRECPSTVVAWADKSRVEQILLNLLSNALKFTQEGSVTVDCDWQHPQRVAITVTDTGVGIPVDEIERIFEPFVQVGRSLTQPHEGTGLGLAISRDLARAMGGDILVTSVVEHGSQFRLILPRGPREP